MRIFRHALCIAVVVASCSAAAEDPIVPEKEAAIRKIMSLTGAAEIGMQISAALLGQIQPAFPDVPDELWAELAKALDPAEATDLVIPIYDRHFTLEELRGLIAFYETPLGSRLIEKLPVITQESLVTGQRWGQLKAQEIIERLAEKGYEAKAL